MDEFLWFVGLEVGEEVKLAGLLDDFLGDVGHGTPFSIIIVICHHKQNSRI